MTDYLQLLEHSYAHARTNSFGIPPESRLEFLGTYVFQFDTDDSEMSASFADFAMRVCEAISTGKTFEFIEDKSRYTLYLLMLNTTFFAERYTCGGSMRGAWWETQPPQKLDSCGLWSPEGEQLGELTFSECEWLEFILAMAIFARKE